MASWLGMVWAQHASSPLQLKCTAGTDVVPPEEDARPCLAGQQPSRPIVRTTIQHAARVRHEGVRLVRVALVRVAMHGGQAAVMRQTGPRSGWVKQGRLGSRRAHPLQHTWLRAAQTLGCSQHWPQLRTFMRYTLTRQHELHSLAAGRPVFDDSLGGRGHQKGPDEVLWQA